MYVSLGFKQVTLGWGSLYEIIKAAPGAFAKHGIVLGGGTYTLKAGTLPAVEGAPDPVALKTPPWTDRFFDAGAEDEVVSAMVAFTLKELGRMERRFAHDSPGRSNPWMKDPTARAWLLETMNNRPAYAYVAAKATLAKTSGQQLGRDAFLDVLRAEILAAYEARDERKKGEHIVSKIPRTAPAAAVPAPAPAPASASALAKAPGADLPAKAAAVLPAPAPGGAGGALLHAIAAAGLLAPALRLLAALGHTDTAALTNLAFWAAHPDLFGTKLRPGQPGFAGLATEWTHLRDTVVRDAVTRPANKPPAAPAAPAAPVVTRPAPNLVPADQAAPRTGATTGSATAGSGDRYFTQDGAGYQDVGESGHTRLWMYGSSAANVCNMTTLTMGLVSMSSEADLRTRLVGLLRSQGMHAGAQVQINNEFVSLAEALDDPAASARIKTIDLVTAVAIGQHGGYGTVTQAATMARIARDTGLATGSEETGQVRLTNPQVRARAERMLGEGRRVILGTVNHYVYLLEVRADGVVVHDPAGARVEPTLARPVFLHNGGVDHMASEFLAMDAGRRAVALRRLSTNPQVSPVVTGLSSIAALPAKDRAAALRQLAAEHPGKFSTGARNFYPDGDFQANDLRLRLTLTAAQ
jgi:hypothetical protein